LKEIYVKKLNWATDLSFSLFLCTSDPESEVVFMDGIQSPADIIDDTSHTFNIVSRSDLMIYSVNSSAIIYKNENVIRVSKMFGNHLIFNYASGAK
jgi:hypothetical protein